MLDAKTKRNVYIQAVMPVDMDFRLSAHSNANHHQPPQTTNGFLWGIAPIPAVDAELS